MGLKSVSVAVGVDGKGQAGFLGGTTTLSLTFERP